MLTTIRWIYSWITILYNRITIRHLLIIIIQLIAASLIAFISPFLLRQLCLPTLTEYTASLYFNFETCHDQLAGVCSFPTAVLDFTADNLALSPGIRYEVSVEIIVTDATIRSKNVGIFQAVLETVDDLSTKTIFRRSCFVSKHHGLIYRSYQNFWNLACKTIFAPLYLAGFVSVADDRKLEISFTDRLADRDIAKTVIFIVQLQNRFIEVESAKLLLRARFGLFRIFLYDYPIISSLLIIIATYFTCLTWITLYWILHAVYGYFRRTDDLHDTTEQFESSTQLAERKNGNVIFSSISRKPEKRNNSEENNFLRKRIINKHQ